MIRYDLLIVGGGLAGLSAALSADPKFKVAVISKVHPIRSHSVAAQGGINAALANHPDGAEDTCDLHAFDTIKGSDYLADQDAAELLTRLAIPTMYELDHWGVPFSRFPKGTIAQRPFGGAGFPRTCYAADRTGQVLLHTLYEQAVRRDITFYEEWLVTDIIIRDRKLAGLVAYDLAGGEIIPLRARAVIFATGGYGRVYQKSTNAYINLGSGIGMAYKAGIPLKDMEFVQFHPTSLLGKNILITEAARGEGVPTFTHFLDLPILFVIVALGTLRPTDWTLFLTGTGIAVLIAAGLTLMIPRLYPWGEAWPDGEPGRPGRPA